MTNTKTAIIKVPGFTVRDLKKTPSRKRRVTLLPSRPSSLLLEAETPNNRDFLSTEELLALGFSSVGRNIRISRKCSFYDIKGSLGDFVRIDDFCILKGRVEIGNHVHICAFCSVSGAAGLVKLSDFSTLANRVSIYTGSDDYRADALSSSTVPKKYVVTVKGDVTLGRAALVGAHSVILPGAHIGDAVSIGAMCVIHGSIPAAQILVSRRSETVVKGSRNLGKILKLAEELTSVDNKAAA